MAPRFTRNWEYLLNDASTEHIHCVFFERRLFVFLPQIRQHKIEVGYFSPVLDGWARINVANPDMLTNDSNENNMEGRNEERVEFEINKLQFSWTYKNGVRIYYELDPGQQLWIRLAAPDRPIVTSDLATAEGHWRLVERSASEMALEFLDLNEHLVQRTFVGNYQSVDVDVKMVMLHGSLHLVTLDRRSRGEEGHVGRRTVFRMGDNGVLTEIQACNTNCHCKAVIWVTNGRMYQFTYRGNRIMLEYFSVRGAHKSWKPINIRNEDEYLDNVFDIFEFNGKVLVVYQKYNYEIRVMYFELFPSLRTLTMFHYANIWLAPGCIDWDFPISVPAPISQETTQIATFLHEQRVARQAREARRRPNRGTGGGNRGRGNAAARGNQRVRNERGRPNPNPIGRAQNQRAPLQRAPNQRAMIQRAPIPRAPVQRQLRQRAINQRGQNRRRRAPLMED